MNLDSHTVLINAEYYSIKLLSLFSTLAQGNLQKKTYCAVPGQVFSLPLPPPPIFPHCVWTSVPSPKATLSRLRTRLGVGSRL